MPLSNRLDEICRFSAMHATTALSKFLKIPIGVDMKLVEIKKINDINLFEKSNKKTVSIYLPITGELSGASFFIYSEEAAFSLCDILFQKQNGTTTKIFDEEISALSEVANIVIGNFLTYFAQSLHLNTLMHQSAIFDYGTFNDILQKRLPVLKEKMKEAVLGISFGFKHNNIHGYVLMLFSEDKIEQALQNISASLNI